MEPQTWKCRHCNNTQNKTGECVNMANFVCPHCWSSGPYAELNEILLSSVMN